MNLGALPWSRMPTRKMRPPAQTTKMAAATAPVERIIRKVLGQRGSPAELRKRAKGDRQKVQLAARLRAQTTVTVAWIAARLSEQPALPLAEGTAQMSVYYHEPTPYPTSSST